MTATVDTAGLSIEQLKERIDHWDHEIDTATTLRGMMYAQRMRGAYHAAALARRRADALVAMQTAPPVVVAGEERD